MARDAITRQYDVDKNLTTLTCEPGDKGYRPGVITFYAKKGKSINLDKIQDMLIASRLSGGTSMGVDYLELTIRGEVRATDKELTLKVAGTDEEFILGEETKEQLTRLREAVAGGAKAMTVTGRVPGWNGRFPSVLKALSAESGPRRLLVTSFEPAK